MTEIQPPLPPINEIPVPLGRQFTNKQALLESPLFTGNKVHLSDSHAAVAYKLGIVQPDDIITLGQSRYFIFDLDKTFKNEAFFKSKPEAQKELFAAIRSQINTETALRDLYIPAVSMYESVMAGKSGEELIKLEGKITAKKIEIDVENSLIAKMHTSVSGAFSSIDPDSILKSGTEYDLLIETINK
jgi:hypothetical protein